ncbi:hypothetical protein GYMLUDRAFT_239120 [Collybiopsis luxurians FD-317 M1]|nr:hypothetical protein GYMLUDRAFT_239120 [Collybiopsis luxurians FD-317 M1]
MIVNRLKLQFGEGDLTFPVPLPVTLLSTSSLGPFHPFTVRPPLFWEVSIPVQGLFQVQALVQGVMGKIGEDEDIDNDDDERDKDEDKDEANSSRGEEEKREGEEGEILGLCRGGVGI